MNDNPQNEYLRAKIMTATPQQLQTMLYDGAIRFCEQARQAIADEDIPTTHARIVRAQRILIELTSSLRTEIEPDICSKLASLYNYIYRLLIDANLQMGTGRIDEAVKLLQHIRETWMMAIEKARSENGGREDAAPDMSEMAASLPDLQADAPAQTSTSAGASHSAVPGGILSIEG